MGWRAFWEVIYEQYRNLYNWFADCPATGFCSMLLNQSRQSQIPTDP